jgi:MFS family permease
VLMQVLLYLLPFFVTNAYTGLLPSYSTDVLFIGPDLFGVINAAPGVGAVLVVLVLASFVNVQRKLFLLVMAGIFQGIVLFVFAFSPGYLLSLLLLIVLGGTGTMFMILNNTIIQEMLPDNVRGRVMSLREVAHGLGPSGSVVSGFIANLLTVSVALGITGGISIVVLAGILLAIPRSRSHKY